jgi:hypothetical protein
LKDGRNKKEKQLPCSNLHFTAPGWTATVLNASGKKVKNNQELGKRLRFLNELLLL